MHDTLQRLFQFKAWANDELLTALAGLGPESPITGLAIKALSHTYVVDRIFVAHMRRKAHAYSSANLSEMPTLEDLSAEIRKSDREYIDYVAVLDRGQLAEQIDFAFTDGVLGRMSREEMLMHDHPRRRSPGTGQRAHAAQFRHAGEGWFHDLSARGRAVDETADRCVNAHAARLFSPGGQLVRSRSRGGRLRMRINTRATGKFSIGSTVVNSGMSEYVSPLSGINCLSMGDRTCQNSFALEFISRTFPDTRQRHGAFGGWARRFP